MPDYRATGTCFDLLFFILLRYSRQQANHQPHPNRPQHPFARPLPRTFFLLLPAMNTHLKLLGVAILWGASWPWGRMVAQALPPITAAAMRFALAALGLLIWLGCSKKGWHTVRALSTRQWLGLAVAAACGVFGYALFFMLGLQYVSASRGAVVITMNPALTLLLAAWLFKERLNAAIILGMLLAIGGALTAAPCCKALTP